VHLLDRDKRKKLASLFFLFPYQVRWVQMWWARSSVVRMGGGWVMMVVVVVVVAIQACGGWDLAATGHNV
jgi:hypothetical protein